MKILVAGAGSIGARHIKNLIGLGYRDISICEVDKKLLSSYEKDFSCYFDFLTALKKEAPDVVFICTPTHLHLGQAKQALLRGCSLFIEKPVSDSLSGLESLSKMAKGKVVMVGCNWRFNRAFKALEKSLRSKRFGSPLFARVASGYFLPGARPGRNYKKVYAANRRGGGVLLDTGSHLVGYLIALFGDVVKAKTVKGTSKSLGIESEETAHMILVHKSGIISNISMDYVSKRAINSVEVICEKGILHLDLAAGKLVFDNGDAKTVLFDEKINPNEMFTLELKHFFKCVANGEKPMQTVEEAGVVLSVILKGEKN